MRNKNTAARNRRTKRNRSDKGELMHTCIMPTKPKATVVQLTHTQYHQVVQEGGLLTSNGMGVVPVVPTGKVQRVYPSLVPEG